MRCLAVFLAGCAVQAMPITEQACPPAGTQLTYESFGAGFMGALASQFWYLAFSIDTAARVRTTFEALLDAVLAALIAHRELAA